MSVNKQYPLPTAFRLKWLAALRSNQYEQGQGYLHKNNKYCCLGIACKILGIPEDDMEDHGYPFSLGMMIQHMYNIPNALQQHSLNSLCKELADMNDIGESFATLADWIEENTFDE